MVQLGLFVVYTGHVTACDTRRRELYCFACSDYIYDADFDSAMLVHIPLLYSPVCLQSCFKTPSTDIVADYTRHACAICDASSEEQTHLEELAQFNACRREYLPSSSMFLMSQKR